MHQGRTLLALVASAALASCASGETRAQPSRSSPALATDTTPADFGRVVPELGSGICVVFHDSKGRRWFGGEADGVYLFDGERVVHYTTKDGLVNDGIRQIAEDDSGHLYFATGSGVSKFDGRSFETLAVVPGNRDDWKSKPGDLWLTGTQNAPGPYRYDGTTLFQLTFPKMELEDAYRARFPNAPYSPYGVYSILRDSRGALWFGTAAFGVCRYDGESFDWVTEDELTELHAGAAFGVRGLIEDAEGKYWLGNLLHRYDARAQRASTSGSAAGTAGARWYRKERGLVDARTGDATGNDYFMSGLTDRSGVSWIATYGAGVWRIEGASLTQVPVLLDGRAIRLRSIYADREGVLWLATHDHGAWRFDGEQFARFRP